MKMILFFLFADSVSYGVELDCACFRFIHFVALGLGLYSNEEYFYHSFITTQSTTQSFSFKKAVVEVRRVSSSSIFSK